MNKYYEDSHITIYHGDCREVLAQLDAASVQTCVTSPPYFGLRKYTDNPSELGLEETPAAYVAEMTGVFEQVRRVLRSDGTAWLNLGDSYNTPMGGATNPGISQKGTRVPLYELGQGYKKDKTLKPKDLIGIPWRVAFALQDAGWWLRSDIIWSKGNPMPESVQDRPTKAHEYIFLLAKAEKYYYDADAIREPHKPESIERMKSPLGAMRDRFDQSDPKKGNFNNYLDGETGWGNPNGRNRRSVWTINTQPYAGAHFAVFPEKLIEPCILAGTPSQVCAVCGAPWVRQVERNTSNWQERKANGAAIRAGNTDTYHNATHGVGMSHDLGGGAIVTTGFAPTCNCAAATIPGTVLDCFGGSGTTARVAKRLGRRSILIEQNERYCDMAASSLLQQAFEVFA